MTGERGLKRGRKRRTCFKKNLYYTLVKLHHRLQIRSHQDPKSSLIAVAVLTGDTSNKVTRRACYKSVIWQRRWEDGRAAR